MTATQAGSRMVPAFAFTAIASFLFGRLSARFSGHKLFVAGYLLIGIAMSALGFSIATTPYWYTGLCLCLLGVGSGLAVPATSINVLKHADSGNLSIASSVMNALRQAGMAFGIAILGSVMNIASLFTAREKLSAAGVEDAASRAHSLMMGRHPIGQHEIDIYHTATAYGFNWAMFLAGGACLAVGVVLALHGSRCRQN